MSFVQKIYTTGLCKAPELQVILIRATLSDSNGIYNITSPYGERSESGTSGVTWCAFSWT